MNTPSSTPDDVRKGRRSFPTFFGCMNTPSSTPDDVAARLSREELLTTGQAAALLPARCGRKRHPSTIYRYIVDGYQGVKLEGVKLPCGWMTSREAVARFIQALTDAAVAEYLADQQRRQERRRRRKSP